MATSPAARSVRSQRLSPLWGWLVSAAMLLGSMPAAGAAPAKAVAPHSNPVLATCSWDRPGHSPFMGDVVAAVDRYTDIPPQVRSRLKQRMMRRDYDEFVLIQRDQITGKQRYDSEIRDMHFGDGSVCRTVTRDHWTAQMKERGLVYCESGECILVPTVCRNVSRIVRHEAPTPVGHVTFPAGPGDGELPFAPPGAGSPAGPAYATPPAAGPETPADAFVGRIADAGPPSPYFGMWPAQGGGYGGGPGPAPLLTTPTAPPAEPVPTMSPAPPTDPVPPLPTVLTAAVPEPQTWLMLGVGLAMLGALRRRQGRAGRWPTPR